MDCAKVCCRAAAIVVGMGLRAWHRMAPSRPISSAGVHWHSSRQARRKGAYLMPRLLCVIIPAAALLIALTIPSQTQAQEPPLEHGTIINLKDTPHLWIVDEHGLLHWASDTRALAGKLLQWNKRIELSREQLRTLPIRDPWLSTGLLKDGAPIYLVKWEHDWATPRLLHIQSIEDVQLFGITGNNYGRFVLTPEQWQRRYGMATESLERQVLPSTTSSPIPTPGPVRSLKPGECAYRGQDQPLPAGHTDYGAPSANSDRRMYCRPYPERVPPPTPTPFDFKEAPHNRDSARPRGETITTADDWQITVLDVVWHYEDVVRAADYRVARLLPTEQWVAVKLRAVSTWRTDSGYRPDNRLVGFSLVSRSDRQFWYAAHAPINRHPSENARDGTEPAYPKLGSYHSLSYWIEPDTPTEGWIVFLVPTAEVEGIVMRMNTRVGAMAWWKLEG